MRVGSPMGATVSATPTLPTAWVRWRGRPDLTTIGPRGFYCLYRNPIGNRGDQASEVGPAGGAPTTDPVPATTAG